MQYKNNPRTEQLSEYLDYANKLDEYDQIRKRKESQSKSREVEHRKNSTRLSGTYKKALRGSK